MNISARSGMLVVAAGVAAATLPPLAAAQPGGVLPRHTVPMTALELKQLYGDMTWQWHDGGGRFINKDRRFIAWSEKDGVPTVAEGHWRISNEGRLCLVAVWATKQDQAPNKTCFEHVRDRGTIYQRREPEGSWYVFKTYKLQPTDEYLKLVKEDTITPNVAKLKESF